MRQNFLPHFFVRFPQCEALMDEGGETVEEFEQVYREYFRDVELYLLALCRDENLAAELASQTFFTALEQYPNFRGECHTRENFRRIYKLSSLTLLLYFRECEARRARPRSRRSP